MNMTEFETLVRAEWLKRFPNGYYSFKQNHLGSGYNFSFGLIGSVEHVPHRIRDNDPLRILLFVFDSGSMQDEIQGKIELVSGTDSGDNTYIRLMPESRYYASSTKRLGYRKINNTPDKVLKSLGKYFDKVKNTVLENKENNNIYNQDLIPVQYFELGE